VPLDKVEGFVKGGWRRSEQARVRVPQVSLETWVYAVAQLLAYRRASTATGKYATSTGADGTTTYSYDSMDRLVTKSNPQGTLNYTPSQSLSRRVMWQP
jgi:YD repeat-containing protein